jgi:aspartate kinase
LTGYQVGIVTDPSHTKARIVNIDTAKIKKALQKHGIVIVAGFQGKTLDEEITTLGRGGSDLTAVALAAALQSQCCEIYTDVDGVYTTDPRIEPTAKKIDVISYEEMLELASLGAKVMHSRSIEVASKYSVPIIVRNSKNNKRGTVITREDKKMEEVLVRGIALNKDEAKVTIFAVPDKPGVAAKIFKILAEATVNVDMIIQNKTASNTTDISFTVMKSAIKKALPVVKKAAKMVNAKDVITDENIAKLSVVGVGMRSHSGVAHKLFSALAEKKINIDMISTSEIKISCIISSKKAEEAVRIVHKKFKLGTKK